MKPSTEFVVETTGKAILNLVPLVGGSIASVWGDIQAERKAHRFNNFLETLRADLENHKERINSDFINKEDFLDVFELTSKKIINERNENKRILYKDILLNAVTLDQSNYDEVEQCIRTVENLTEANLYLLKVLSNPEHHNNLLPSPIPPSSGNMSTTTRRKILIQLMPEWNGGMVLENLKDLEFLGLINEMSSSLQDMIIYNGLAIVSNQLTLKGERLIKYIQGKNGS
jgi:hypothetical protein